MKKYNITTIMDINITNKKDKYYLIIFDDNKEKYLKEKCPYKVVSLKIMDDQSELNIIDKFKNYNSAKKHIEYLWEQDEKKAKTKHIVIAHMHDNDTLTFVCSGCNDIIKKINIKNVNIEDINFLSYNWKTHIKEMENN